MVGLRLSPVGRRATVMMMVMVVVTLLVGDAGVLAGRISGDVAYDQLRAVALGIVAAEVLSVSWFIQGLLATERRMAGLVTGGLVQVLPGLTVVPIQTSPALRRAAVEAGHSVAVGRRTMTVMLTASSTVST